MNHTNPFADFQNAMKNLHTNGELSKTETYNLFIGLMNTIFKDFFIDTRFIDVSLHFPKFPNNATYTGYTEWEFLNNKSQFQVSLNSKFSWFESTEYKYHISLALLTCAHECYHIVQVINKRKEMDKHEDYEEKIEALLPKLCKTKSKKATNLVERKLKKHLQYLNIISKIEKDAEAYGTQIVLEYLEDCKTQDKNFNAFLTSLQHTLIWMMKDRKKDYQAYTKQNIQNINSILNHTNPTKFEFST